MREDLYIKESLDKLAEMAAQLENEKDTLTTKKRDELRCKSSALRSRVNRKLELRAKKQIPEVYKSNFSTLIGLMIDEMNPGTRARIMSKITNEGDSDPQTTSKADLN